MTIWEKYLAGLPSFPTVISSLETDPHTTNKTSRFQSFLMRMMCYLVRIGLGQDLGNRDKLPD